MAEWSHFTKAEPELMAKIRRHHLIPTTYTPSPHHHHHHHHHTQFSTVNHWLWLMVAFGGGLSFNEHFQMTVFVVRYVLQADPMTFHIIITLILRFGCFKNLFIIQVIRYLVIRRRWLTFLSLILELCDLSFDDWLLFSFDLWKRKMERERER